MNVIGWITRDVNKMILNFLIIEGYMDAAEQFAAESGLTPTTELASIRERMLIRSAIQAGRIDEAIERINEIDSEILDTNPKLFFRLQQQKLIEFIRRGEVAEALEFAQEELAPRGEENPEFLEELERTMALLAFDDVSKSPVGHLMEAGQRQKTASEVNAAILSTFCQDKDPKLPIMLKMLVWAQNQLEEKVRFPKMRDFALGELEEPMES